MSHSFRSGNRVLIIATATLAMACAHPQPGPEPGQQVGATKTVATDPSSKTLAELFQGKFPGVQVTAVPGGVRLVIRNAQNIDGSPGYPLYVIDGNPLATPDGVLSMNPNDVAKIEVLKDDASTLIWGQRAANGVVKITTKRK